MFLKKPETHKERKRVGRGPGSGHGKTSCRGQKGQMSRSGATRRAWFEGGQMPLQRRVPKRGFNNINKKNYQVVNIGDLSRINSAEINPEILEDNRIIRRAGDLVKILGSGDLSKSVKVTADAFTGTAKDKIEKAGGEALVRDSKQRKEKKKQVEK